MHIVSMRQFTWPTCRTWHLLLMVLLMLFVGVPASMSQHLTYSPSCFNNEPKFGYYVVFHCAALRFMASGYAFDVKIH